MPLPHLYGLSGLSPKATSPKAPAICFPLLSAAATNSHSLLGGFWVLGFFLQGVWLQNEMSLTLDLLCFLSQNSCPTTLISLIAFQYSFGDPPTCPHSITALSPNIDSSPTSPNELDGFLERDSLIFVP